MEDPYPHLIDNINNEGSLYLFVFQDFKFEQDECVQNEYHFENQVQTRGIGTGCHRREEERTFVDKYEQWDQTEVGTQAFDGECFKSTFILDYF